MRNTNRPAEVAAPLPGGTAVINSESRGNAAALPALIRMGELPEPDRPPAERLRETNTVLAEWAARCAGESEALIRRFEAMGYAVAGKSEDEIAEILKKPPTRPVAS